MQRYDKRENKMQDSYSPYENKNQGRMKKESLQHHPLQLMMQHLPNAQSTFSKGRMLIFDFLLPTFYIWFLKLQNFKEQHMHMLHI